MSDSPIGLQTTRLLCPRDSPNKNTGVGCHFLLQGTFPTQRLNPHLLHGQRIVYHWATREACQRAYHIVKRIDVERIKLAVNITNPSCLDSIPPSNLSDESVAFEGLA